MTGSRTRPAVGGAATTWVGLVTIAFAGSATDASVPVVGDGASSTTRVETLWVGFSKDEEREHRLWTRDQREYDDPVAEQNSTGYLLQAHALDSE